MTETKGAKNLKRNADRAPEELRAMGAKGGKASGASRKRRKATREMVRMVLNMNVTTTGKTRRALKKLGYDVDAEGAPSVELLMQIAIANLAMSGDLASAKFLYDYAHVPDIRAQLERERLKAQAEAREKATLLLNTVELPRIIANPDGSVEIDEPGEGGA